MRLVMMTISLLLLGTQDGRVRSWDFENMAEGTLPGGWKAEAIDQ